MSPDTPPTYFLITGTSPGSPDMSTALKTMSSKEPSISPEIRFTASNSPWKTPETAVPMETTVEPVTLQSANLGSGSTSLSHLPTGATSPTKSPIENMVATDRVSLSPSPPKAWTNLYSGTPGRTRQSLATTSSVSLESPTARSTTGTGQQSSPELISKTTGMDFSMWHGSTGGTTVGKHVSLSTSSNILEDPVTSPNSVSSVVDNSKFKTEMWVSTTVIPSTVLSNKTMVAEQQTSPSVDEAYSSTSSWSDQTSGSGSTLGASPDVTNTLHVASTAQTTSIISLPSGDQGITSLTNVSGGKTSSPSSVTSPSTGPETLMAVISVATSDTAPTPGQLSQTSSPVEVSTMGVATALTPGITTTITTIGTNTILTTTSSPEGGVSTMDSTLATERSTSTEHTPTWSSTAASDSWTVTDMASNLKVASSPGTMSTMHTNSFLASSMELDSMSTPKGLITVTGTSLVTPSSDALAIKTETSTSERTLSPSVTTVSTPISNFSRIQSTSVTDISSTSWTPSRTETEDVPVSMASTNYASIKTGPNMPLSTFLSDSPSTLDWDTGKSVSSATATTSAPHGATTPQEFTLEMMISPTTSQLSFSTGDITSGVTPAAMVRSSGVTFSRPDLTSKKAEQSSTQLPTTTAHPEETIKVTSSSSLLRTSDAPAISLESAITSSSNWKSSLYESPYAPSESTTDKESIRPSTNIVETTPWVTSSKHASHSTVPAHSESSKLTSPVVTASTRRQAIFSVSTTTWPESTRAGTEPNSSLTTEPRDFNPYMDTSSTTQTSIISSPGSTAITKGPRTEITSSFERISSSFLAQSMRSSDRPSEIITRLSNFPAVTESGGMALTMQTGPPGATSLSAPTLDTSATASWAWTPLAMTKRFTHSGKTSLFSKGPEDTSQPSPASVEETSSFSSLAPIHATTSSSNTLLTSQGHSPSSTPPVTSVLQPETSGLGKTTDVSKISLEPGTSLPPNLGSTAGEALSTYEATRDTKVIHPSENTAMKNAEATSSEHSPVPVHIQPSKATSPMVTSQTMRDITASTLVFGSSETTEIETASSVNPGLQERSTSQVTSSATETSTVITHVSTGDAPTDVTKTQVTFSSRTSIPSPYHFKTSTNTFTNVSTNPSTSLLMTESSGVTITTQTGPTGATTQGLYLLDTSAMPYLTETPLAVTPDFMQSEKTTPMSKGPRDVSWTSPPSVAETSSPSSLTPILVTTSPPATSTLQGQSTSSPASMTSVITSGLMKTTDKLSTSMEPMTISPQTLNNTSSEILPTSEATTDIETMHPSINIVVTNVGATSSASELHSTVSADSEPSKVTSPYVTTSTMEDATISRSIPRSSKTTRIETETTSSLTPKLRETSISPEITSSTEISTVPYKELTGVTAKVSRTDVTSSSSTSIPGLDQSTVSLDISTETTRLFTSPIMAESAEIIITTLTSPHGAISQDAFATDTLNTTPQAGIHSVMTHGFPQSDVTTLMSGIPKDISWTSPPSVDKTSSPSSFLSLPAMTTPSLVSSTLPEDRLSSPMTSLLTSGLVKITDILHTRLEPVTSSLPHFSGTSDEILTTSKDGQGAAKIDPSINTAETNVKANSSGHESHSSTMANSETSKATTQMVIATTGGDPTPSTSMPMHGSSETTNIKREPASFLTPKLTETSTSQESSFSTDMTFLLSNVPTGTITEVSGTEVISSSKISTLDHDRSTMQSDTFTGENIRVFTSSIMTKSAEMTITTQASPSGSASHGTLPLNTSTTHSQEGSHSTVTQRFPHSEVTTFMSMGPENVSWMTTPPVEETSSVSSLMSSPAVTSPSVSSTLPESILSSPLPVTALPISVLVATTDVLGTSPDPVTSSPPNLGSTTYERLITYKDSAHTEILHPSTNTSVANVGTSSSGHESQSSVLADSKTSKATS
ncbi:Mucin-16, partial [Plecturocebus cupreus]